MAELKAIVEFLDNELKIADIKDTSNNGLQVEGKPEVRKIAFAVDGCLEVFEKAIELGADMVIVHHGISWADSLKYITKMNYIRINLLIKNGVSLCGYHLPLDKHPEYGNNIQLARLLDLQDIKEFGTYHGVSIGFKGMLYEEMPLDDLKNIVEDKLNTKCMTLDFGKKMIKTVGIVSGGGGDSLGEAVDDKLDCFLIGEGVHYLHHESKEGKINILIAGHYNTETLGVKALMQVLEQKFGVETIFIDVPTLI